MALNYTQPGDTITAIAPSGGVISGNFYKLGTGKIVLSLHTVAQGKEFEAAWVGVCEGPKAGSLAIAQGDTLYWDDTAKVFNKTSSGNVEAGIAAYAAGINDPTVQIRLRG